MFTDKYITFPVKEYSQEQKELTGKEISNYRISRDNDEIECITVTLKNGCCACVYLTIEEFEKLLNQK